MASQTLLKRPKLLQQVRDSIPPEDRAVTEQEVAFLITYRQADEAGKRRITRLLHAAGKGQLPPPEVAATWTREQLDAFADRLPEVAS